MKKIDVDDRTTRQLSTILAFSFMTDEERSWILSAAELREYGPEEPVIAQGTVDQSLYAVVSGSVKVSVKEPSGQEVYICTIGEGEVFGEAGLFMKVKRTANVTSCDTSRLLYLDRRAMISFIRKNPVTGNKLLMVIIYSLLRKLREANQELAFERHTDVDQADIDSIVSAFSG